MNLEQIQLLVEQALEDGKITQAEMDEIEAAIHADGVVSAEEAALLDSLYERCARGEIELA